VNALIAVVLGGVLFVLAHGVFSVLIQRVLSPLYARRLLALPPPRRVPWLTALLLLPAGLAAATMLPLALGAAFGFMPVTEWCRRLHTHCDLWLGSEAATEVLVYGAAGATLAVAVGLGAARLGAPLIWATRRVSRGTVSSRGAVLDTALARLRAEGQVAPRVVVVDALGGGAAVFGLHRPVVLLSAQLLAVLDAAELHAVLLHERAHFERRDGLLSMLVGLSRLLSPLPGAGRALTTRWHRDRELLCDDAAVRAGAAPVALAQALVRAARLPRRAAPSWAPALVDDAGPSLTERVERLLGERAVDGPSGAHHVLLFSLSVAGLTAWAAVLAGEPLVALHCLIEEGVHFLT
jgi:Zn-dependent protease with chaperone function